MEKGTAEAKVTFIFFVYFIIFSSVSQGQVQQRCIAYPDTIKMVQGRKYILKCFIKGDEYSSTTTTVDGYPLLENSDGDLEYAIVDSTGEINSTGILAKNIEDRTSEELNLLKTLDKESMERISKLSSRTFGFVSTDFSNSVNGFPPTGTRNLLVLLIDFTDLAFQIAGNNFNNLMNQVNYNGTGSFRDYWVENSYNNLTINSTVRGWYRSANNLAFYGANSDGSDINPRLLVREAIDAAENEGIDFSIFDSDNDGFVDGIIVVHAGYGEEAGGGANTIWSHHWTLGSYS